MFSNLIKSHFRSHILDRGIGSVFTEVIELWTPFEDAYAWFGSKEESSIILDGATQNILNIKDRTLNGFDLILEGGSTAGVYTGDKAILQNAASSYRTANPMTLTGDVMFIAVMKLNDSSIARNTLLFGTSRISRTLISGLHRTFVANTQDGIVSKVSDVYRSEGCYYDSTAESGKMRQNGRYDNVLTGPNAIDIDTFSLGSFTADSQYHKEIILFDKYDEELYFVAEGYVHWNNGMEADLPTWHKYKAGPPVKVFMADVGGHILTDNEGNEIYTIEVGDVS